jgi:hypothetical protein
MTVLAATAMAGPPVFVGRDVPAAERRPLAEFDHRQWSQLLKQYVDDEGMVDYGGWQSSPEAIRALDSYLNGLSTAELNVENARNAQIAFWINAYNALTIKGILREYPTSSIRNHTAKLWGYNIWKDLKLWVGGEPRSLDMIEHEILREMGEPRIHFAIVCASIGCPRLLNQAYDPVQLEQQLDVNTRHFFADRRKFMVDEPGRRVRVSPILDWFGEDFGQRPPDRLKWIAPYLDERSRDVAIDPRASIEFLDYDWSLNDGTQRTTDQAAAKR